MTHAFGATWELNIDNINNIPSAIVSYRFPDATNRAIMMSHIETSGLYYISLFIVNSGS